MVSKHVISVKVGTFMLSLLDSELNVSSVASFIITVGFGCYNSILL